MSDKSPDEKDDLLELIKKLWLPVAGFLGAVTLTYNFYQLWQGDQATVTWFLAGGGLIIIVSLLFWVALSKYQVRNIILLPNGNAYKEIFRFNSLQRGLASLALITIISGAGFCVSFLIRHRIEQKEKTILLITEFDGPEDQYGIRNQIIEQLNANFENYEDIEIISTNKMVTVLGGSRSARRIGENRQADIVVWGWYRPTENPNITIHVENLNPNQFKIINDSNTIQPIASIAELESFTFQHNAGADASALLYFLSGYLDYENEEYEVAIENFTKGINAIQQEPIILNTPQDLYFFRGSTWARLASPKEAIADYTKSIDLDPSKAMAYFNRGIQYEKTGQDAQSFADYSKAITLGPNNPELAGAYSGLGAIYARMGDFEKAIENCTLSIELDPEYELGYYTCGYIYSLFDYNELAISQYQEAIELNPEDFLPYFGIGNKNFAMENYDAALEYYTLAIELNPDEARIAGAYAGRGLIFKIRGLEELALVEYNKAIQVNPEYAFAYGMRGELYIQTDQVEKGITDFDKAIELEPNNSRNYGQRGAAYVKLQQYDLALRDYSTAIKLDPKYAWAYGGRGNVYQIIGDHSLAVEDFNKAIELDPEYAWAYVKRGNSYWALGFMNEPFDDYNKAVEIDPSYVWAYECRGSAYYNTGLYNLAVQDYSKVIELDTDNASAYRNRGYAFSALDMTTEANADFAKYKELTGEDAP